MKEGVHNKHNGFVESLKAGQANRITHNYGHEKTDPFYPSHQTPGYCPTIRAFLLAAQILLDLDSLS